MLYLDSFLAHSIPLRLLESGQLLQTILRLKAAADERALQPDPDNPLAEHNHPREPEGAEIRSISSNMTASETVLVVASGLGFGVQIRASAARMWMRKMLRLVFVATPFLLLANGWWFATGFKVFQWADSVFPGFRFIVFNCVVIVPA